MYEFVHLYRGKKEVVLRTNDKEKAVEWSKTFLSTYVQTPEHRHILKHGFDDVSIEEFAETHLELNVVDRERVKGGVWWVNKGQERNQKRALRDAQRYQEKKKLACAM